jgi:hypothetical protein
MTVLTQLEKQPLHRRLSGRKVDLGLMEDGFRTTRFAAGCVSHRSDSAYELSSDCGYGPQPVAFVFVVSCRAEAILDLTPKEALSEPRRLHRWRRQKHRGGVRR